MSDNERKREAQKRWRDKNKEQLAQSYKEWSATDKGKQSLKERGNRYRKAHPDKRTEWQANRRARTLGVLSDERISVPTLRDKHGDFCYICDDPMLFISSQKYEPYKATIEHLVPLILGGLHSWENCRLTHFHCNLRKGKSLL